jgi:bifunctional DNA-binding transcriptional regulator/antitoxin component of YhaV-PrlF toxin-antitoxin module
MTDFDYKKYSLENLENWMHDAISSAEATPQEIYDVIKGVVEEQYYYFKHNTQHCYELLALLNGNGKGHIEAYDDYVKEVLSEREYYEGKDDGMRSWGHSDLEYQVANKKEDKVVRWQLPVEMDGPSGEYFVSFPDDLLEAANLKEGDQVEWVDQGDGSYLLRKVENKPMTYDEMIAAGWTMTGDGFWIKEKNVKD